MGISCNHNYIQNAKWCLLYNIWSASTFTKTPIKFAYICHAINLTDCTDRKQIMWHRVWSVCVMCCYITFYPQWMKRKQVNVSNKQEYGFRTMVKLTCMWQSVFGVDSICHFKYPKTQNFCSCINDNTTIGMEGVNLLKIAKLKESLQFTLIFINMVTNWRHKWHKIPWPSKRGPWH